MNIGMITCNYFMRIYNYQPPEHLDWGKMVDRYHAEFTRDDFLKMAAEIRAMGYENLEIWEANFSHKIYSEQDARDIAAELHKIGFQQLVYCIGGWGPGDVAQVEPAYRFATALGAKVVDGCIPLEGADTILREIDRCGRIYGIKFAIENHPAPSVEKPEDVARLMSGYETVGANLDTGIYNMLGYDVIATAKLFKDKIYHVHFKDTVKGGTGCLPIGGGDAPMAELLKLLRDWNYDYMVSVEFEYEGDPAPGLVKSMDFIRASLA